MVVCKQGAIAVCVLGQSLDCNVEDFARASSAQDKVCCVEEHIEPICEDFFDNGFRYKNYICNINPIFCISGPKF